MLPRHLNPGKSSPNEVVARDEEVRRRQCRYYNQRHRARRLSKLEAGDPVWVTDMQSTATVLAPAPKPRSYVVRTDDGVVLRRTRRMLNRLPKERAHMETYEFPENSEQTSVAQLAHSPDGSTATDSAVPPTRAVANSEPTPIVTRFGRVVKKPIRLGIDE
ncbi:hypothetical protein MTO96_028121 [Rhipicephalus appendiculatus]